MAKRGLFVFLGILLTGCKNQHSSSNSGQELSNCELHKYHLIWNMDVSNTEWRMEYLDYVSYCLEDSSTAIQLAKLDGENHNYNFIIYGLVGSDGLEHFENIYKKHPMGFHCPGCETNEYGEIYNRELKIYLKKNEGLDYDSILNKEFGEYPLIISGGFLLPQE